MPSHTEDELIRRMARAVKPRKKGQTKKGAAIAILKSKGVLKQVGRSLEKVK